jgi:tetratricopeptide (TPR) repeat protein
MQEGNTALQRNDLPIAVQAFVTVLAMQPGNPQARHGMERAQALIVASQPEMVQPGRNDELRYQALRLLNADAAARDTYLVALGNLALFGQGNPAAAIGYYDESLKARDNPLAHIGRGVVLAGRQDKLKEGLAELQAGLEKAPTHALALETMASAQLAAGDADKAVEFGNKALAARDRGETWAVLARAWLNKKDDQKAADAARNVIQRAPKDALGYRILGGIALRAEQFDQAESLLREAYKRSNDTLDLFSVGQALRGRGKLQEALQLFLKLQELRPQDLGVVLQIAELLEQSRNYEQAISVYQRLANLTLKEGEVMNETLAGLKRQASERARVLQQALLQESRQGAHVPGPGSRAPAAGPNTPQARPR